MSLNVKAPEAHRLAQAIAQATGETMTRAVTEALRERYERLHRRNPEPLAADIRAIADRAAAHVKRPYLDHAELRCDAQVGRHSQRALTRERRENEVARVLRARR